MKTLFNKLALGLIIGAIAAVSAVSIMAQDDPEKTALYTKFTECYKAQDDPGMRACLAIGESYMQKYGTPPDQYTDFVGKHVKNLKDRIAGLPLKTVYQKLDSGIVNKNLRDIFDGGREVLRLETKESIKLDVNILMATAGYDAAFAPTPDLTYKAEALNSAKTAIRMIEAGTVSEPKACPVPKGQTPVTEPTWGFCGAYAYKSKDNALAWMNFTAGRLIADTNKDTTKNLALLKEAAPFFYKSVQYNSDIKKFHTAYQALGRYYLEELNNTVDQYEKKTCKDLPEDNAECKNLRGVRLAYAERGLDAYARAYKIAKDDPKQTQAFKDSLNKTLSYFYNARYEKMDGMNEYLAKVATVPLVDPSAPVTPIEEVPTATGTTTTTVTPTNGKPAATTTTTTTTTTIKPAVTPPASTTKPAATPGNSKPAKPSGTKGTVAKKAPAKKKAGR